MITILLLYSALSPTPHNLYTNLRIGYIISITWMFTMYTHTQTHTRVHNCCSCVVVIVCIEIQNNIQNNITHCTIGCHHLTREPLSLFRTLSRLIYYFYAYNKTSKRVRHSWHINDITSVRKLFSFFFQRRHLQSFGKYERKTPETVVYCNFVIIVFLSEKVSNISDNRIKLADVEFGHFWFFDTIILL